MMRKRQHNRGFSLVELLLAVAILALIMIGVGAALSTTTRTYTRTRDNIEVKQNDQNAYDFISDKMMQAKEIRIGSGGNIYAMVGTNGSTKLDTNGRLAVNDTTLVGPGACSMRNDTPMGLQYLDKSKVAAGADGFAIDYISVYYEMKNGAKYQEVIDTFYFYDEKIYMVRSEGAIRTKSVQDPTTDTIVDGVTYSSSTAVDRTALDAWWKLCINEMTGTGDSVVGRKCLDDHSGTTTIDMEDYLMAENVTAMTGYVNAKDDSVYLKIDMEKGVRDAVSEGLVRIRNSHVLVPKNLDSSAIDLYERV